MPTRPIPFNDLPNRSPKPYVPPSGFTGNASQTPAAQATFSAPSSIAYAMTGGRRRKRRKAASSTKKRASSPRKKRASSRRKAKRAILVKGSAAAKRYMAKLRRMRKK